MKRRLYATIAIAVMAVSITVGALVYSWENSASNYTITLNPSQTAVDVRTTTALYSVVLFLCGAFFSAGLAMVLNFVKLEK